MIFCNKFVQILGILFFVIFISLNAQAEEKDLFEMSLEELLEVKIVTASRSERSIEDLPVTIHVVSREEILTNNYANLVDVLKDLPGIKVSQPGSGVHGDTFLMRGMFGNYYTKILLNGIPIQPSVVDGMPIWEQVNIKNVERIEVIWGPASALYGADALAGVINIITYSPDEDVTRAEISVGEDGYLSRNFYMNQSRGDFLLNVYGVFGKREDMNIYETNPDAFGEEDLFGNDVKVDDLPEEGNNIGIHIQYKNLALKYDYMYRMAHSSLGQTTDYYIYDNPDILWGEKIQNLSLHHEWSPKKEWIFNTTLSYLRYRLDTESAFGMIFYENPLYKYMASDDILFEEVVVYNHTKHLEIVGGLSYQYSGAMPKTNDLDKPFDEDFYEPFSTDLPDVGVYQDSLFGNFGFNPFTYSNIGGFIQGTYSTDKFTLIGGVRYDDHSEYESSVNPRIAGLYNFTPRSSVRVSYGTAYKAPSPYQVYNSLAVTTTDSTGEKVVDYWGIPNEDLDPEEFSAIEVGLRHIFNENVSLELVGYHNKITGLITNTGEFEIDPEEYPNPKTNIAGGFVNNPEAESILNGVDLILHLKNIIAPIRLNSNIYVSYKKGEETLANGDEIDDFRMAPEWLGKLRIKANPLERWSIGIDNIFSSEWYGRDIGSQQEYEDPANEIDGYYTMDIFSNYTIPVSPGDLKLNFRVTNLFDEAYGGIGAFGGPNDLKYNPQYGRMIYAGIEYSFR